MVVRSHHENTIPIGLKKKLRTEINSNIRKYLEEFVSKLGSNTLIFIVRISADNEINRLSGCVIENH
jgi:hypothetical protein